MKKNKSGFSMVELMAVVAVTGVLAAIAIPNYQKYLRRGRQAEAKVNLGSIYLAEIAAMQDQHTYTSCFGSISGSSIGLGYYAYGFENAVSDDTACAPYGAPAPVVNNCLVYNWVRRATPPDWVAGKTCAQGPGNTYFEAVQGLKNGDPTVFAKEPELTGGDIGWNIYTASAGGWLGGERLDTWTIDSEKTIVQTGAGI